MTLINIKLCTICLLDAITVGSIIPIFSYHIFALGGTHTTLGILASSFTTFQLISGLLISYCESVYGEKLALLASLLINFLTYSVLGVTTSLSSAVLLRLLCALTNQTQSLCKTFMKLHNGQEKHEPIYNVLNAFSVVGFVIGPIIGGHLYELENGFYYITVLSSMMLAMSFIICLTLPGSRMISTKEEDRVTFLQRAKEDFNFEVISLRSINIRQHWDVVLLKLLYHASITVFFIKFSMLLKLNYSATPTVVGYTYAYQNAITFLSHFLVAFIRPKLPARMLMFSLFSATFGFYSLCYAPSFDSYLVLFIPTAFFHNLINGDWNLLFKSRSSKEGNVECSEGALTKISSVMTPVIFGMLCDLYGHHALKAFVILPLLLNILIAVLFYKPNDAELSEDKEK